MLPSGRDIIKKAKNRHSPKARSHLTLAITVSHGGWLHGENSSDLAGREQRDGIQCRDAFKQFTSQRFKVDEQHGPLRRHGQQDTAVARITK